MQITHSNLLNFPVLSLRTGGRVGTVSQIIVNPFKLNVQALKLSGSQLNEPKDSYLLVEDIRELSPIGIIINDSEDLVGSQDVIRLQKTLALKFSLLNLPVIDRERRKVGKVIDYIMTTNDLMIYQLAVRRPMFKDFFDPELLIHRSQILELSQDRIVIKNSLNELRELERQSAMDNFVNPFRSKKPAKSPK